MCQDPANYCRGLCKQPMKSRQCKQCGGEMRKGTAIEQTYTSGPQYAIEVGSNVRTRSPGGQGKIITVMKCVKCGWSVT